MALRDQPYLPLYIQDFMTDEKLIECSAEATGVYIRIMCVMHKSNPYGTFLLKQNDKQNDKQILNFATKLARFLPYDLLVILRSLTELLENDVLSINGDYLEQKRMIHDGKISITRSVSGKSGGDATRKKSLANSSFAIAKEVANMVAKNTANSENEVVNDNDNKTIELKEGVNKTDEEMIVIEMNKIWVKYKPGYCFLEQVDYPAYLTVAYHIAGRKNIRKVDIIGSGEKEVLAEFDKIAKFLSETGSNFFRSLTVDSISIPKNLQKVEEAMRIEKEPAKIKTNGNNGSMSKGFIEVPMNIDYESQKF